MLLCITCSEVYNKEDLKPNSRGNYMCPRARKSHYSKLIEVDDGMVEFISTLFNLNLETWSSCSGHFYEELFSPYIYFGQRLGDTVDKESYPIDIEDLHNICKELSNDDPFDICIEIENIKEIAMNSPYDSFLHANHKVFRVSTYLEEDENLKDRIEIQNIFFKFLDNLINIVYNLQKDNS